MSVSVTPRPFNCDNASFDEAVASPGESLAGGDHLSVWLQRRGAGGNYRKGRERLEGRRPSPAGKRAPRQNSSVGFCTHSRIQITFYELMWLEREDEQGSLESET